jgi:hypothetical protein
LSEERRLKVLENRVLRRIFAHKRARVTREWRKLHMICILHPLWWGEEIENKEMGCPWGAYGEGRGVYRVLVKKPEGKRPLGRPRLR